MPKKPQTRHIPGQAGYTERSVNALTLEDGTSVWLGQNLSGLVTLDEFARLLMRGEFDPPFYIVTNQRGNKVVKAKTELARYFPRLHTCVEVRHADLEYAPHIRTVLDAYWRYDVGSLPLDNPSVPLNIGQIVADQLNCFAQGVREEMIKNDISRLTANWDRGATKNHLRMRRYMARQFECTPNLSVVFLELTHRHDLVEAERIVRLAKTMDGSLRATPDLQTYRALQSDAVRFFEKMRRHVEVADWMVGHVWSLERSLYDMPRLKTALLFDGSKVCQGDKLGEWLGKFWADTVAPDRGVYRVLKHKDPAGLDWATYPISATWTARRDALVKVLGHMAMRERYCRFKIAMPGHSFGTGHMPPDLLLGT